MTQEVEKITPEMLREWDACTDGYKGFCKLFPEGANLQTAMAGLINDLNRDDWAYWLFKRCRERGLFKSITDKGYRNSGDWNSGDWNSGDRNSGYQNNGYRNSGNWNSGDRNSGNRNSGNWNSGDRNSGYRNSGDWNSGDRNSGDWNSGDRNSGDRNSGYQNSGDWNSGDRNSGFFNSNTPKEIIVFNKPCPVSAWENAYKPNFLFFDLTLWISSGDMSDEEKAEHSYYEFTGGYLLSTNYKEAFRRSWELADPDDRAKVKDLPNFDADVFYEISGIDLREGGHGQ